MRGTHRPTPSPRDLWNAQAAALGLTVTDTGSDGWHRSWLRADGLHLWTITHYRMGMGIQSAWLREGRYADHRPYWGDGALAAAARRETSS